MDYPLELLSEIVPEIPLTEQMTRQFDTYAHLLEEWNQKINLSAIKEPREVVIKHFADSIIWLKFVDIPNCASVIDIGTGAGFPGIPLKIVRPDVNLTLLDSLNNSLNNSFSGN